MPREPRHQFKGVTQSSHIHMGSDAITTVEWNSGNNDTVVVAVRSEEKGIGNCVIFMSPKQLLSLRAAIENMIDKNPEEFRGLAYGFIAMPEDSSLLD